MPAIPSLIVPIEHVVQSIHVICGQRVMIDADLAKIYGVQTKVLNKAVARNLLRFPGEFMFQLTAEEAEALRFQNGTSTGRGGRRYIPFAFTEHGVGMLASVLSSPAAVAASILVVKAFVQIRQMPATNDAVLRKLADLERSVSDHDSRIKIIFDAIRQLMASPAETQKAPIGFVPGKRAGPKAALGAKKLGKIQR